jgi:Type II CAAX prenyl endopeptidase Rce1-like
VIQARLAVPRRAALVTSLVLGAALLRAVLLPLGDLLSTAVFAACLLTVTWMEHRDPLPNPPHKGEGEIRPARGEGEIRERGIRTAGGGGEGTTARGGRTLSAGLVGLLVGAVLVLPNAAGHLSGRPLDAFWSWAAVAAVVATLEETAIRGVLYRRWLEEAGPVVAIIAGAIVFALIHLPRYRLGAMPLDLAVGLALGGLRAFTGRVMPCAVAHTIADWGAWFWV